MTVWASFRGMRLGRKSSFQKEPTVWFHLHQIWKRTNLTHGCGCLPGLSPRAVPLVRGSQCVQFVKSHTRHLRTFSCVLYLNICFKQS